jgi:hypothetical protein
MSGSIDFSLFVIPSSEWNRTCIRHLRGEVEMETQAFTFC